LKTSDVSSASVDSTNFEDFSFFLLAAAKRLCNLFPDLDAWIWRMLDGGWIGSFGTVAPPPLNSESSDSVSSSSATVGGSLFCSVAGIEGFFIRVHGNPVSSKGVRAVFNLEIDFGVKYWVKLSTSSFGASKSSSSSKKNQY
jgi:hypothetical protein